MKYRTDAPHYSRKCIESYRSHRKLHTVNENISDPCYCHYYMKCAADISVMPKSSTS